MVPANTSRFFLERYDALNQPLGTIQLVKSDSNLIQNIEYNSKLIKYDEQYCTTNSGIDTEYSIPSLRYFKRILSKLKTDPVIIEIGCGQGEFVSELVRLGITAHGYDPVLRTENSFLHKKNWNGSEPPADLYILRCVLPHIQNPWSFLGELNSCSDSALVLVEYQRLEWILQHGIWYQINHDHTNLFTLSDFEERYSVLDAGTYANGEWEWVLIQPKNIVPTSRAISLAVSTLVSNLFEAKEVFLDQIASIDRDLIIWGAAGKGAVLAHALTTVGLNCQVIDADKNRWTLYLEGSGVQVQSPKDGMRLARKDSLILVCNPNHLYEVRNYVGESLKVILPSNLITR